ETIKVEHSSPSGWKTIIQGNGKIEGFVFGDPSKAPIVAHPEATTLETLESTQTVYELDLSVSVTDDDGSEWLGDVAITGIPSDARIDFAGDQPDGLSLVQENGQWFLRWDNTADASAKQAIDLTLRITDVPQDADFSGVAVSATAHELTMDGVDAASAIVDASLGSDDDTDADADSDGDSDGSEEEEDPGSGGADDEQPPAEGTLSIVLSLGDPTVHVRLCGDDNEPLFSWSGGGDGLGVEDNSRLLDGQDVYGERANSGGEG